jgi:hypothetical protein
MAPHHEQQMNAYPGRTFVASGCWIQYQQAVWLPSRFKVVFMPPKADLALPALGFRVITVLGKVVMLFLYSLVFCHDTNWHCCKVHIAALPFGMYFEQQKQTNKQQTNTIKTQGRQPVY